MVYYDYTFPDKDEDWATIDGLRFSCNLNAAAAALKLGMHAEVLQQTYEALKVEPNNAKALYRRAQVTTRVLSRCRQGPASEHPPRGVT